MTGMALSLGVLACLARAVDENREVQAVTSLGTVGDGRGWGSAWSVIRSP
jgi:hypothetical protein